MKIFKKILISIFAVFALFITYGLLSRKVRTGPAIDIHAFHQARLNSMKSVIEGINRHQPHIRDLNKLAGDDVDAWGTKFRFEQVSANQYSLTTAGPDKTFDTRDDGSTDINFKPQ